MNQVIIGIFRYHLSMHLVNMYFYLIQIHLSQREKLKRNVIDTTCKKTLSRLLAKSLDSRPYNNPRILLCIAINLC